MSLKNKHRTVRHKSKKLGRPGKYGKGVSYDRSNVGPYAYRTSDKQFTSRRSAKNKFGGRRKGKK